MFENYEENTLKILWNEFTVVLRWISSYIYSRTIDKNWAKTSKLQPKKLVNLTQNIYNEKNHQDGRNEPKKMCFTYTNVFSNIAQNSSTL